MGTAGGNAETSGRHQESHNGGQGHWEGGGEETACGTGSSQGEESEGRQAEGDGEEDGLEEAEIGTAEAPITMVKTTTIKSVFAIIQLVAFLQIAASIIGPSLWNGRHSDLKTNIASGGDVAVTQFMKAEQQASKSVTSWGAGFAFAVLVVATIGSMLSRKPKES